MSTAHLTHSLQLSFPTTILKSYNIVVIPTHVGVNLIQPENEKMIISTTTCNLSAKSNILSAWLQLPQNFLIPNPHQIEHYLFHHTNMIAPTKDLCHAVYNKTSPSFQLSLELYQDYEEEDFNCLTINLRSHNYPESTMQLIDHLVTDTADILKSAPEFIAIHTNFEPPI